ncbi:NAD(P)-binding protein [Mytilinidion resinicola]|uniref:NAD(P)-binding protein n=1 Tax=Mytilinidion resinicola TaxID=574789 RepID=A0A6A6Y3G6_9PEZI|nr:NAD(P)-binding protein [Mytilinidion resinicola]KAF2803322.1 NAD(P)-binding protein [Mytilinidion resinicola]
MPDQVKYANKLHGARILIIGGSSGIGYGLAEACLEFGATVIISSSNPTRIASAISALQSAYPSAASRITGYACELANAATLDAAIVSLFAAATSAGAEKLDHVVFTAGDALMTKPLPEITLDFVQQAGMVRFFAPLLIAREAAAHLRPSYTSSYTITTGSVSQKPMPGWAVIGAYAGGHHTMARGLALDMRPVRVNAVSPGAVDTALWRMGEAEKKAMFEGMEKRMATGRVGRVEDVVETYLGVLRDENCTGSVVSTNGGVLIM